MGTFVVVVGGGPLASSDGVDAVGDGVAAIIAVDGGLDVALAAGLTPTLLVGDLDSISACGLEWVRANDLPVEEHPADKDATDTALALAAATSAASGDDAPALRLLCGSATDRLDHLLGILTTLGAPALARFERIDARIGTTRVHVLHPAHECELALAAGAVFSLLALHGPCRGVDVEPARWPLHDATLLPSATVGVSNESCGPPVSIRCADGVLTVIVPAVAS